MSEQYTPTIEEMRIDYIMAYDERGGSQLLAGAAFDRGVAKIKADALRNQAEKLYPRTEDPRLVELDVRYGGYYTGIRSARKKEIQELLMEADRIEQETK